MRGTTWIRRLMLAIAALICAALTACTATSSAPSKPTSSAAACPKSRSAPAQLSPRELRQLQALRPKAELTASRLRVLDRIHTGSAVTTVLSVDGVHSSHACPALIRHDLALSAQWIRMRSSYEVRFYRDATNYMYTFTAAPSTMKAHYILISSDQRLFTVTAQQEAGQHGESHFGVTLYHPTATYSMTMLAPVSSSASDVYQANGTTATEACQLQATVRGDAATETALARKASSASEGEAALQLWRRIGQEALCNSFGVAAADRLDGQSFATYQAGDATHVLRDFNPSPYVLPVPSALYEALPH